MVNGTNPELKQERHLTLRKGYILLVVALLVALAVRYMSRVHLSLTPSALLAMGSAVLTIFVVYYFSHRLTVRRTRCYIGPALLFIGISYGVAHGEAVFPISVLWSALLFGSLESYVRADVVVSE
jgi:hypothetical protein